MIIYPLRMSINEEKYPFGIQSVKKIIIGITKLGELNDAI